MGKYGSKSKRFRVEQEEVTNSTPPPEKKIVYWVFDRLTNRKIGEPYDNLRDAEDECQLQNNLTP